MKLKKENFNKKVDVDVITYSYRCNETDFFMVISGGLNRQIAVFSGSEDKREKEKITEDALEAWNYFEDLLEECQPEQSNNLANNPQANQSIIPYLAITNAPVGTYKGCLFAIKDNEQVKIFEFTLSKNALPDIIPDTVFEMDWKSEDVAMLLKCEVILKKVDDVVFEEDKSAKVFLFIPKSIPTQGGEEAGQEAGDGEGDGEGEKGEGKGKGKGKPDDSDKAKADKEAAQKSDAADKEKADADRKAAEDKEKADSGEGKGDKGDSKDDSGEGKGEDESSDENGESGDNKLDGDGAGYSGDGNKYSFSELIQKLSDSTEVPPSNLISSFRTAENGELFLLTNNFEKIKKDNVKILKVMTQNVIF